MCDNIKVAIKVRPLIRREQEIGLTSLWRIKDNTIASIDTNSINEPYCFDHIFDETKSTQSLFEVVAKPIIQNCMKGINGTIFAYGQTSSGKTHTMTGTDLEMGVIPLSIHQIFHEIESMAPERQFLLRIAYIEIYNEKIFDLLDGKLTELKIRDTQNCGEAKVKCHEIIVNSPEKILHYLKEGNVAKRMEETNMNERSSRSHTIFRITIESRTIPKETDGTDEGVVQISNLNLVDLAGSEKADQTGTTGARLKEGAFINRSLFSLGFVIKQLSEKGPDTFINYRDSKLTRILQASLGGNSMTTIICTITPATVEETNYTLFFATRAKTIKNKPIINETVSEATVTRRMQKEISRLKEQLQVEERKNCKNRHRIEELERDINERETKFVGSYTMRTTDKSRRRTWCPSSTHVNELSVVYEEKEAGGYGLLKLPSEHGGFPNINLDRESPTPSEYTGENESISSLFLFRPTENNLSFGTSSEHSLSPGCVMTPLAFRKRNLSIAKCANNCQCDQLEKELNDLKEFTRLERKFDSKSSTEILQQDHQELKDKLFQKNLQLETLSSRNSELELQLIRLTSSTQMENNLEKITKDLNEAIKSKEAADQAKVCAEYEYDQLKKRTASREKELTDLIEEFRSNDDKAKILVRIQSLENKIKEMENENLLLQTVITSEKQKCGSLNKINSQLISDLEQEKSKFLMCCTDTKNTIELLEENNKKLVNDLDNAKINLKQLEEANLVLSNELENNKNALLVKAEPCGKCVDFTEKLDAEQLRYGKLKQDYDAIVSSDLQEIQKVVLTLQNYLKSLVSEEWKGVGNGKENKNINDYIKDLKTICSFTSHILTEKQSSNGTLNESIEDFSSADLTLRNSSLNLSARDEVVIESLQNRTIDLENQIMKISNQLNREFDTKALQTEWRFDEFIMVTAKYTELQKSYKKLQEEYDEISTGIMDWIQENEEIKKQLIDQEAKHGELNEKYKALLVEMETLEEHKELISLRANYEAALKLNQSLQENLNDYSALKSKYDNLFDEKRQLEEQLSEKRAENELQHSIEIKYEQLLSDKNSLEEQFFAELLQNDQIMAEGIEKSASNPIEENLYEKSRKQSLNELSLLQMKYTDLERENQPTQEIFETNKKLLQNLEILTREHESLKNLFTQTSGNCTTIEKQRDFIKFKYSSIIKEYRQLYSSVSNYETKIDNLEKEARSLKEALVDFELIQNKYEKLRLEKFGEDNSSEDDDLENCEITKKLINEIGLLNDKFEAVVSERNLVEANYELLLSDYNSMKKMLDVKIATLDSFRQKYEDVLIERAEQQKIIDELHKKCDEYFREFEKQKNNYEEQLSEKQEVIRRINIQIEILKQANSDLQAKQDGSMDEISTLKDAYTETKKLLDDSRETEKSLEQNIISLTGNISVLQGKNEEFEQVIETLKSSLKKASGFETKYSTMLIEKQIVEKQVKELSMEMDNYERKFNEMHAAYEELQGIAKQAEENHNNLLVKLTEIQESKAAIEVQLRSEMIIIEQKREKVSLKLQEMQNTYEELQRIAKQTEENHNKLLTKLGQTQESKLAMETQLRCDIVAIEQRCENDLKISNKKIEEFKYSLQEVEATKSLELESVRQLFENKYNELERNKTTLEKKLKSEINSIQKEYNEIQKSEENLKCELKALETEKSNLQKKLVELEEDKYFTEQQLKFQLDSVKIEFAELQRTLKDSLNGKSSTEQELASQLSSLNQKYGEMEKNLKSQLNIAQQEFETLQTTTKGLSSIQEKYDKLQASYEELETTKAMMEKNINSMQQNSDRMQITIKTLEQRKAAVEEKWTQLQSEHHALKERHTLLLDEVNELEKSAAKLEEDNKALKISKYELETSIKIQAAQIFAINTKLTESETKQIKLKADHEAFEKQSKSLQVELDKLKSQSKFLADHTTELKDKSKRIEILENKKKELLAQLHELQNMHLFKTSQFENEVKALNIKLDESNVKLMQVQKNFNMSKNKLSNENSDLKKKNQTLFFELDDIKRKQNERKSKRSITYDNNRSTLLDVQTVGTMTDKTDPSCNCDVMDEKIKELTRENYIKECHITNYQIKEKNNPLIMECSDLKEKLILSENYVVDLQRQLAQLNIKLRKVREISTNQRSSQTPNWAAHKTIGTNTDTDMIKSSPNKQKHHNSPSSSKQKPVNYIQTTDRLTQTEFILNRESTDEHHTTIRQLEAEINRLRMRYEESKCLAIARRRKIDMLNDQIGRFQRA